MNRINGHWKSIALVLISLVLGAGGSQVWTGKAVAANAKEITDIKIDVGKIQTDVNWIRARFEGGEAQ